MQKFQKFKRSLLYIWNIYYIERVDLLIFQESIFTGVIEQNVVLYEKECTDISVYAHEQQKHVEEW